MIWGGIWIIRDGVRIVLVGKFVEDLAQDELEWGKKFFGMILGWNSWWEKYGMVGATCDRRSNSLKRKGEVV